MYDYPVDTSREETIIPIQRHPEINQPPLDTSDPFANQNKYKIETYYLDTWIKHC